MEKFIELSDLCKQLPFHKEGYPERLVPKVDAQVTTKVAFPSDLDLSDKIANGIYYEAGSQQKSVKKIMQNSVASKKIQLEKWPSLANQPSPTIVVVGPASSSLGAAPQGPSSVARQLRL